MIHLEKVSFSYGEKAILRDFDLLVADGELVALMGPSGCGKSTLVNLIAGLRKAEQGTVQVDEARPVYVFQEPRLFPWLTVRENIAAVLPEAPSDEEILSVLRFVGLEGEADTLPADLSGGMKSRAALARALLYGKTYGSRLYLLDEPFAALDEPTRIALRNALRDLFRREGATAVLVTHDRSEAESFSDRIVEM